MWTFGGVAGTDYTIVSGGNSTSNTSVITWLTTGTKTVTVNYTDGNGCTASTATSKNVKVNALPTGTFTISETSGLKNNDSIICVGAPVTFTAPAGNGSYIFKVDGTTVQTGTSNTYSTSSLALGVRSVTVDVANSSNCGATFGPMMVTVNALPTATLSADKPTDCANDTITFTAGSGGTNYNFKVNSVSVQSSASNIYKSATLNNGDTVTVDVTNANGCVASSPKVTITINALPTGTLAATENSGTTPNDNKICVNDNITFTATPNIAGYTYNFKVNGVSAQNTSSNTYTTSFATAGARLVTVEATNSNGCTGLFTPSITVTVNALPTGSLVATETSGVANNDNIICAGAPVTFTAPAGNTNYAFYLNGTGAPVQNGSTRFITVSTLVNGDHFTVVVTNNNGCMATLTSPNITVLALPAGTLTASANPICAGDAVDFTATSGFSTYTFKKNGATFQTGGNNVASNVTGLADGDIITVTVSNAGACSAVFNADTIKVNPLPVGTLTALENSGNAPNDNIICKGDTVVFKATAGYSNYNFELNGTTVQYGPDSIYSTGTLLNGDKVSVEVTSSFGCVASFNTVTITVNNLPPVDTITGPTTVCVGSVITLNSLTPGGVWSSVNNAIATVNSTGDVTGVAAGEVTITYTVTNANGCSRTVRQRDTVLALPIVGDIMGNLNICTGDTSRLSDTTLNGVWSSDNTAVATISSTGLVTGVSAGTDTIRYAVTDAAGCTTIVKAVATITLSPTVAPITTTAPSFDVCVGGSITLKDATPSGVWSTGDGTIAIVSTSGVVTGVSAGTVNITYAITTTCGSTVSTSQLITVHPLPGATISGATSVCQNSPAPGILFTGSGGTAPYTFTYRINGGSNLTVTTVTGDTVTVFAPTGTTGTFTYRLISVKDASPTQCSQAIGKNAVVTVNPLPVASVSGTTEVCVGSPSPNITFTGSGSTAPYTFTYDINGGGPLTVVSNNAGVATVPASTATAGIFTYNLESVQDASTTLCSNVQTGSATVTVDPASVGGSVTADATVCSGSNSGTVTLSGNTGNVIRWELSTDGGTTWSPIANTTTSLTYTNITTTTLYRAVVQSGTCSSANSSFATITVNPVSVGGTVASAQTICSGSTPADLSLTGNTGNVVKWQSASDVLFTTPVDIANTTTTLTGATIGALTATTYFRAVVQSGVCASANSASVKITVNPRPTGVISGTASICTGSSDTLILSVTGSGTISGTLSDGTPFSGTAPTIKVVVTPAANTTYTIATLSDANCTANAGDKTGSATITLLPVPTISSVTASPGTVCPGSPSTLTVPGAGGIPATIVNYNFNTGGSYGGLTPTLASGITSSATASTATFGTTTGTASGANAFTSNPTAGNALFTTTSVSNRTWVFTLGGAALPNYKTFKIYYQAQRNTGGSNTVTVAYSLNGGAFTSTGITPGAVGANPQTLASSATWYEVLLNIPSTADNPTTSLAFQLTVGNSGTGNVQLDNFQVQAVAATTNVYSWTASPSGASAGLPASAGTPSTANSTITVSPTVTTTYTVTATNAAGCSATKPVTVNVYAVPTVTITANYCDSAGHVHLTAVPSPNTNPPGPYTYLWSTGATTQSIYVDQSDQYSVTVTTTNGCTVNDSISVAEELVTDGDFETGGLSPQTVTGLGFTSDYNFKPDLPGLVPAGQGELYDDSGNNGYSITPNGQNVHINFWGHDHTTGSGNFMAVNGHGNTLVVWKETVPVLPNTTYYFSAWAMSLNSVGPFAQLQFSVNGLLVGTAPVLPAGVNNNNNGYTGTARWTRFYGTWTSGPTTTSAVIYINDLQAALGGNDFGLDDISFGTLSTFVDLQSDSGTDNQNICVNTPITDIVYNFGNGSTSNPTVSGLPAGVNPAFSGDLLTITGTPTIAGNYTYNITTTGCKPYTVTGTITVQQQKLTSNSGSLTQTVCINTPITNTVYTAAYTDGSAVTNVIAKGLPAGVTAGAYNTGTETITISGTPTVAGIFKDTLITVGSCRADTAYGTITVQNQSILAANASDTTQIVCKNTDMAPVTYNFGGTATGATISWSPGVPAGVSGSVIGSSYVISGTPSVAGTYHYTVTTSGTCAPGANTTGTITVNDDASIALSSAAGTDNQTVCANTQITDITYTTAGSGITGASITSGALPAGVTGSFSGGVFTIKGTPTATGTFNYTVTVDGACASAEMSGTINVQSSSIALTSGAASQTLCLGTSLTNIVFTIGGGATGASISWSPSVPADFTGNPSGNTYTISGGPATQLGTFNYTVTTSGGCSPDAVISGSITVNSGSVGGNLPALVSICSGTSGFLNLTGSTGSVQHWEKSTDGGTTWTNIANTTTTLNYGVSTVPAQYRALVKSGSCTAQYSSVAMVAISNYWVGTSSSDWNAGSNWSDGAVPSFATCNTVVIPAGTPFSPQLTSNVSVPNINIAATAYLDLNGNTLTITGTYSGTGTLTGSTASRLIITGAAGTLLFTPNVYPGAVNNNYLHTLIVNGSGSATLGDSLNIGGGTTGNYGTVISTGSLSANGNLTLKSDVNGTAIVAASTGSITGDVTVERYVPPLRAWRFMAVPFSSSSQTMHDSWQEGVNNTDPTLNYANNLNPHPGFGTHITGNNNVSLGYDYNTTQNPSVKVWDPSTNTWNTIEPATNATNIAAYNAYCLFVRGSRAVDLALATNAPADPTVLRIKGILNQAGGNVTRSLPSVYAGEILFIGNPYAAPIDLNAVFSRFNASTNIASYKFWVWNPSDPGTFNTGGYVTWDHGVITPTPTTYAAGTIIQSGQAFMLQATANGTVSYDFEEGDKVATETNVFGKNAAGPTYPVTYVNLTIPQGQNHIIVDGVATAFGKKFSPSVDVDDADKQWNFDENIATIRDGIPLAIEFRPLPDLTDTLFYRMYLRQEPYSLQVFFNNFETVPVRAWIVDKYLNTKTEINLHDTTYYDFTPNPDTNSYRNRFMIVFNHQFIGIPVPVTKAVNELNPNTTGVGNSIAVKATGVAMYPNPANTNKVTLEFNNMDKGKYEITVYSPGGQKLASRKIEHNGGNNIYPLPLNPSWAAGIYTISIAGDDPKKAINLRLVIGK
jgi:hypothetical protein